MSERTIESNTNAESGLTIRDEAIIDNRLPNEWTYWRHVSTEGEAGLARRKDEPGSIRITYHQGGQWRVSDGPDAEKQLDVISENAAVETLFHIVELREAERVVNTAPEYDPEFRDDAENDRANTRWMLDESRALLPREREGDV